LALSATTAGIQNLDMYLELELKKDQYSIRSFALGGCPYCQISGVITSKQKVPVVDDIGSCKLTQNVLKLFDGLDMRDVAELRCFVTDCRKSLPIKFACSLVSAETPEPIVKAWHTRSYSAKHPQRGLLGSGLEAPDKEEEEASV
jgi:hypothetical protein